MSDPRVANKKTVASGKAMIVGQRKWRRTAA
jgi:hypothetical protein